MQSISQSGYGITHGTQGRNNRFISHCILVQPLGKAAQLQFCLGKRVVGVGKRSQLRRLPADFHGNFLPGYFPDIRLHPMLAAQLILHHLGIGTAFIGRRQHPVISLLRNQRARTPCTEGFRQFPGGFFIFKCSQLQRKPAFSGQGDGARILSAFRWGKGGRRRNQQALHAVPPPKKNAQHHCRKNYCQEKPAL